MNILLINPSDKIYNYKDNSYKPFYRKGSFGFYSLTLPMLGALVPPELNATIKAVDEGVEPITAMEEADIVGITTISTTARRAYDIAAEARKLNKTVVMGGVHVTLNPDEAARHADAIVLGLAEQTWPQLLRDYKAGKMKKRYEQPPEVPLKNLPVPRRELLNLKRYLNIPIVQSSRGCINHCDFCCVPASWGRNFHHRPIPEVVEEIKALPSKKIIFMDPSVAGDLTYFEKLITAITPLGVKWVGAATVEVAANERLLKLAIKSGCKGFLLGLESVTQDSLNNSAKPFNKVSAYEDVIKRLHDHGLLIVGTFMLGMDNDDLSVFEKTYEFVNKMKIDLPRYGIYTPFPGTPAFKRLEKEKRIITREWAKYNYEHAVFTPHNMSVAELESGLDRIRKQSYSLKSIITRSNFTDGGNSLRIFANLTHGFYASKAARVRAKMS